jgi:hypothetical protein
MIHKRAVSDTAAGEEGSLTFKSDETIWGRVRQADESIQYNGILKVEESGRVSLELSFVPPHPFILNMPENHRIVAQRITEAYARLVAFLDDFGIDLVH